MKKYILVLLVFLCSPLLWAQTEEDNELLPPDVTHTTYEHEIELKWEDDESEGVSWEVFVNGELFKTVTSRYCIIYGLDADTEQTIQVHAVKGEERAEGEDIVIRTNKLKKEVNDLTRIPYLRTVELDGTCPRILPLYYNDLANAHATITYKLNGQVVKPQDNKLEIKSNSYRDRLEINIDEGEGRIWKLIYYLAVKR